ncbi:MATE family efflux transporter [Ruegeria sp. HKCCSP351]|uniref:MATE family efflux transporter n=1 Tax=Ruegeria sp. HKCCSP351 TaxID=2794832 RepID=UPI001AE3810C|nr:MATE family efflux transporter [Ruegeria sp. HKCCSP351]
MQDASAPISHGRVLKIAVPIVLSNATVPILGAVDTGVVGQLGQAAPIGAVGIGAVILSTIYWIFGFLRMGTTGMAAQARGAGDAVETRALLMRGLMLGGAAGLFFVLTQVAVFAGAFALSPASPEVETLARAYLEVRIWGAPATIALYAVTGWLIAVERTRGVFVLQVWMNGLNIVLDLWFVLGLGWGVEGVAIATLIAEWTGLALGLWLCRDGFEDGIWRDWARILDAARLRRMLQVNGDIMIRSVLLTGSFTTFLFVGSDLGDVNLAANQVLLQFLEITAFALDGFAFSAEALVGSAVGARDRCQVRRASVMTSQWGVGGALLLGVVFFVAGPALIDLMSTSPQVREAGREFLVWAALAPVIGVASWMFDGIYIGATWTRAMRSAMFQSVAIYLVALFILVPSFGNHGLWAALMVLNIARGVTLGWRYPKLEAQVA